MSQKHRRVVGFDYGVIILDNPNQRIPLEEILSVSNAIDPSDLLDLLDRGGCSPTKAGRNLELRFYGKTRLEQNENVLRRVSDCLAEKARYSPESNAEIFIRDDSAQSKVDDSFYDGSTALIEIPDFFAEEDKDTDVYIMYRKLKESELLGDYDIRCRTYLEIDPPRLKNRDDAGIFIHPNSESGEKIYLHRPQKN